MLSGKKRFKRLRWPGEWFSSRFKRVRAAYWKISNPKVRYFLHEFKKIDREVEKEFGAKADPLKEESEKIKRKWVLAAEDCTRNALNKTGLDPVSQKGLRERIQKIMTEAFEQLYERDIKHRTALGKGETSEVFLWDAFEKVRGELLLELREKMEDPRGAEQLASSLENAFGGNFASSFMNFAIAKEIESERIEREAGKGYNAD